CSGNKVGCKLVELSAGECEIQVLGACCIGCDVGLIDVCACHAGKLNLGLFGSFLKTLHSHPVARKVDAFGSLELSYHPVDDSLVEIVTAETVVTCCCKNLDGAVAYRK